MAQRSSDRWGCDRFPRRRTDRLQTVVGWTVVAAALLTVAWAVVAAGSAYRSGLDRIRHDADSRTMVVGVLLDDAAPAEAAARPVRVSYLDPLGRTHLGQVSVSGRLLAGTPVRVEVDGDGNVGVEPPTRGDAVFSAVAAAVAVILGGAVLLAGAWAGTRSMVTARNHAAWEREWRLVEPRWSGRGTAAA